MDKAKIDIPVALVFFNRPEQFARVFETVREAKPTKLFLIQDGPRVNNMKDLDNIQKCRDIINVDWECDVETDYSVENLGCGRRIYSGISSCFEKVDRLVILEDDCVPSQSFFTFCHEVLEKYKEDLRIGMITGMNHLNRFEAMESDYFFANVGSIAGWATWKRAWDDVSFEIDDIIMDSDAMRLLRNYEKYAPHRNRVYSNVKEKYNQIKCGQKLSSWSTQFGLTQILNSRLIVVPKVNLMTNIGLTEESSNSVSNIKFVPRGLRPLYRLQLFEMNFPLKHPKYVICDLEYNKAVDRLMRPNKFVGILRTIESVCLRLIGGDFKSVKRGLKRRLHKVLRK